MSETIKEVLKIVVLQSGEHLVGGLIELTDEEGKGICFSIKHPYVLRLVPSTEFPTEEENKFVINFAKWLPFSPNINYRISYPSIVTIADVDEGVYNVYMEKFGHLYENSTETTNEWKKFNPGENEK